MEALKSSPKALKSKFKGLKTEPKGLEVRTRGIFWRNPDLSYLARGLALTNKPVWDCDQALSPAKHVTSVLLLAGLGR